MSGDALVRGGSLKRTRSGNLQGHVRVVEHVRVPNRAALDKALEEINKKGGEGLMLREPGSMNKTR